MSIAEILTKFDDILYTWCLIYMLAGAGIYFTVRTRFVQLRLLGDCFKCMFEKKSSDKGISSFQALMIATFAFGFNGLQAYNIVSTMEYYFPDLHSSPVPLTIGCILFAASLYLFFAGAEKIGWLSSVLVPIMSGLYIVMGILIIILNIGEIPAVLASVIRSAFDFKAIFSGFTGSCMVYGIKRGLFSNEAGMGSAPNASASAEVSHPAKQGLAQIISVYIDTLMICSATVFILLLTGVYKTDSSLNGIPLLQQSVAHQFGTWAIHVITIAVCMFAFTSIVGNYFYAEANILFISKNKVFLTIFRIAAAFMVLLGALNSMDIAWSLADITMGLEAVVNIIAIFLLSRIAFDCLRDYEDQKAKGIDPVFHEKNIGLNDTDVWK